MAGENGNGNGLATSNKQVVGWLISALAAIGMMLFQWAILGAITDLRSQMATVSMDVASLKTSVDDVKSSVSDNKRQEQDDIDHLWAAQREPKDPPKQ